jgi:hypothetical protein
MLFLARIEVGACGLKSRPFTLGHLVNVDSMFSRRKVLELERNADAGSGRRDRGTTNALTLPVFYIDDNIILSMSG